MIGENLGSFRIEEQIGAGAMGVVYRAVNEKNGRVAAVKVVTGEVAQKGVAYERFRRESEILQQFRHPNIVRFLAVGRYQGTSYFAMEFVPGITLDELLKRREALPWPEVASLGIQICEALHYAHERQVVHRDLKPSNLMITEEGQVKLTDFGIAKDLDATALTATGRTVGTAAYMAPEQIRGAPAVSHKTDLYALGVVLYQMLVGEVPFAGQTAVVMMHKHLNAAPPRPSEKILEIPLELDQLVVRLMAKEPADRPWDAAAVGHALSELRARRKRGESIPMVWPSAVDAKGETVDSPSMLPQPRPEAKPRASRKGKKSKPRRAAPASVLEDPRFQTAMLALGLVGLLGLLGYQLWPPSAEYLHRRASAMMDSGEPTDWILAQKSYIEELERRHPGHPYAEQTRAWRDQILLHQAGRRAAVMEKGSLGNIARAQDEGEEAYMSVYNAATEDLRVNRDVEAARRWRSLAETFLREDAPEDHRKWGLLARQRAKLLEDKIADRRRDAIDRLERADALAAAGRLPEALRVLREVVDRFEDYPELAEPVALARSLLARSSTFPRPSGPPSGVAEPEPSAPPPATEATIPDPIPPDPDTPGPRS